MRIVCMAFVLVAVFRIDAGAQNATLRIEVHAGTTPVADVSVVVNGTADTTDAQGLLVLPVPAGAAEITAVKEGFSPVTTSVQIVGGQEQRVVIELSAPLEEEVTVIASTRTERRIEDQPMRVEVLPREGIEEKLMMTPGDIVMMLNEMGGLRVQSTSPSLGASSVRIQGMRGRYTRFLSDGLPLFGEQSGLGLLQIPPMDLGQVEVIKGVASALYGAGAMGGVVNLISRRPGKEPVHELLVNRTTRGGTDTVLFLAGPMGPHWGFTLLGGGHWQDQNDVTGDGWADLPGYSRGVVRPRLFWDGGNGNSFFATAGLTWEDRTGGTQPGSVLPATAKAYTEALETRKGDFGAVGQVLLRKQYVVTVRVAASQQRHGHQFGEVQEQDRHDTAFGEMAVRGHAGAHTWVVGAALEQEKYRPRDVLRFAYSFAVPGVFVQDDIDIRRWLAVSVSGRADHHSEYGHFFSPRVSALARAAGWTSRISVGTGFFAPTPLTEETEAAGLSRLVIAGPLQAERGQSASLDVSRTQGPISYTLTVFRSRVRHPIKVEQTNEFALSNLPDPATNAGIEILGTLRHSPFTVTGTYSYVRSRELDSGIQAEIPLTPRHSAGLVAMAESEQSGRIGLELYFTGRQRLELNPYRNNSRPYWIVGFLAERRLRGLRLFVNAENLTGVRQTDNPMLRPTRAIDGRWTVDGWAPLEGRVINGGIRVGF